MDLSKADEDVAVLRWDIHFGGCNITSFLSVWFLSMPFSWLCGLLGKIWDGWYWMGDGPVLEISFSPPTVESKGCQ